MSVDLGRVNILGADAIGKPGQRQFRLFAQSAAGSTLMWLEKEQLDGLSVALDRSLALITEGQVLRTEAQAVVGEPRSVEGMPADFPKTPGYEFQVGQMRLNFNEQDTTFELNVVPLEVIMERGQEPQVRMREEDVLSLIFTQLQAQQLSSLIRKVITGGRPVCPFCHTPLDGGPHACVKQNGHREVLQIEEGEE